MEMLLDRVAVGITKYNKIMAQVYAIDVSADSEFQKFYNGFYRMRQRTADFYQTYYAFLEQNKGNPDLTFEEILTYLYEKTGAVHASFSSKLLATVNPNMPIWDKFVLQNLGLRTPYTYQKDRLQKTVQLYQQICDWYESEQAKEKLREFNELFPNVDISDVKKIDFILWATR